MRHGEVDGSERIVEGQVNEFAEVVRRSRRPALLVLLMAALVVVVAGTGGPRLADTPAEHSAAPSRHSPLPVVVLAIVATVVIVVAMLAYLRHPGPAVDVVSGSTEKRRSLRFSRRGLLTTAAVAAAGTVAVIAVASIARISVPAGDTSPMRDTHDSTVAGQAPPPDTPVTGSEPPPGPGIAVGIAGVCVVAAAVVTGGVIVVRSRRRDPAAAAAEEVAVHRPPASGRSIAARAAAELAAPQRDPRAAIIACYAVMESAFGTSGTMQVSGADTAAEVLAKAVRAGVVTGPAAAELVELFCEARFSPHPMTDAHRHRAAELLTVVIGTGRS